jgi:hypothetical protein
MELPTKPFTIVDKDRNVTYTVLGYREPTPEEAQMAVRVFLSKQKKMPKNKQFQIQTLIGAQDPIDDFR